MLSDFYKYDENDVIWWCDDSERRGSMLFSFDKKNVFNFWEDYPHKLTDEQKRIFDNECGELARLK